MASEQLELPGMPTAESVAKWLRRSDLIEGAASARLGLFIAEQLRARRKISISFALDLARTFGKARFAHNERRTLAALASLTIEGVQLASEKLPDEKEVVTRLRTMATETSVTLENLAKAIREIGGDN